jgi:hypothetical protein
VFSLDLPFISFYLQCSRPDERQTALLQTVLLGCCLNPDKRRGVKGLHRYSVFNDPGINQVLFHNGLTVTLSTRADYKEIETSFTD